MRDPIDIKRGTTAVSQSHPTNIIGGKSPSLLNFSSFDTQRIVKNAYQKNSLIASVIGFYQRTFAQATFKVFDKLDPKKPGDLALSRLLSNPNPEQTESRFKNNIITNLLNFGDCYVLLGRNASYGNVVTQLWCYNKGLMRPVYDEGGYLSAYEYYNPYRPDSRRRYKKEEVIHLLWTSLNPNNPNESISPIEQLTLSLETDNEIDHAVYTYLKNDMMRGNLLKMREGVKPPSEEEAKVAREMWAAQTTGDSLGIPPWLTGIEDVIRLSGSFDELDSEGIRKSAESRVASVFGIDPEVLGWLCGAKSSTYNNVKEKTKRFITHTFAPMLDRIGEDMTLKLDPHFGNNNKVGFDKANIPAYREVLREEAEHQLTLYKEGTITLNEFRTHESVGLEIISEDALSAKIRYSIEGVKDFRTFVKDYFAGVISDRNSALEMAQRTYGYTSGEANKILPILRSQVTVGPDGINQTHITESNRL